MGNSIRYSTVLIVKFVIFSVISWSQEELTNAEESKGLDNENPFKHEFIVPANTEDDHEHVVTFYYGQKTYLVINYELKYIHAKLKCKYDYRGALAIITTMDIALFLGDALSETNMLTDSLWVGGKLNKKSKIWEWSRDRYHEAISETVNKTMVVNEDIAAKRECLAFARANHTAPQLHPLSCSALRGFICERPGYDKYFETHPGWIKIGKRLYKIFNELVEYDGIQSKCFLNDPRSNPAVIKSYKAAQILGRYLLIGRPSLENAWIGAQWKGFEFRYQSENIPLRNKSDRSGFPPWINGTIQKPAGCILLDRHLDNMTYFIEARCSRYRPYICYKKVDTEMENISSADIIIGNRGYRLHLEQKTWYAAVEFCRKKYENYLAKLVEITENDIVDELLYVMGENKTTTQHIWIGGKYEKLPSQWYWISDRKPIDFKNLKEMHMVDNSVWWTYLMKYEEHKLENTCLNMDRENHIKALYYGTECYTKQDFVCQFTAKMLRQLQKDESRNMGDTDDM